MRFVSGFQKLVLVATWFCVAVEGFLGGGSKDVLLIKLLGLFRMFCLKCFLDVCSFKFFDSSTRAFVFRRGSG